MDSSNLACLLRLGPGFARQGANMGWRDKVDEVVPGAGRGVRLTTGQYIVLVHEAKEVIPDKGENKGVPFCVHRFELLQTSSPEFPVGIEASEAIKMVNKYEAYDVKAAARAKSFCAAVAGIEPLDTATVMREVTGVVIDTIYGPRNPARGSILALKVHPETEGSKTRAINDALRASGQHALIKPPFMIHEWHPVLGQDNRPARKELPPLVEVPTPMAAKPSGVAVTFGSGRVDPAAVALSRALGGALGGAVAQPTLPVAQPALPTQPALPVATFPPAGWTQHNQDPSYYFNAQGQFLKEPDLRAAMALGKA